MDKRFPQIWWTRPAQGRRGGIEAVGRRGHLRQELGPAQGRAALRDLRRGTEGHSRMSDRRTILLLGSRRCITPRKERFSYDMRGDS